MDLILNTLNGTLENVKVEWCQDTVVGLVAIKEDQIISDNTFIELPAIPLLDEEDANIFCGKTKKIKDRVWAIGDRVLGVVAKAPTIEKAFAKMETTIAQMDFEENILLEFHKYRKKIEIFAIKRQHRENIKKILKEIETKDMNGESRDVHILETIVMWWKIIYHFT